MIDPLTAGPLAFSQMADGLSKLLIALRAEKERRHRKAGRYFTALGKTLQEMTEKLRRKEIPRVEGNRFNGLVSAFDKETSSLPAKITTARQSVRKAAYVARRLDWHYIDYDEHVARTAERWLADMERTAGFLQAVGELLGGGA
jgi:hypothetical protein